MARGRWIGPDGWPCEHPPGLIEALSELPGADSLGEGVIEDYARLIEAVYEGARDEEMPASQVASAAASDKELVKLHDLATQLADHIDSMHQPAVSAVWREGARLRDLADSLRQTAECARISFGYTDAPKNGPRRPQKIVAAGVTDTAAGIYESVTGKQPTFTTGPETGDLDNYKVSGSWPDFLGKVFKIFGIDASVASQVKAQRKNNTSK